MLWGRHAMTASSLGRVAARAPWVDCRESLRWSHQALAWPPGDSGMTLIYYALSICSASVTAIYILTSIDWLSSARTRRSPPNAKSNVALPLPPPRKEGCVWRAVILNKAVCSVFSWGGVGCVWRPLPFFPVLCDRTLNDFAFVFNLCSNIFLCSKVACLS